MNSLGRAVACVLLLPAPFALCGEGDLLYLEEFDGNGNCWNVQDTGESRLQIKDGKCLLESKRGAEGFFANYGVPLDKDREFQIEAELQCMEGNSLYGLMWGGKDGGNYLLTLIDPKGTLVYARAVNGKMNVRVRREHVEHINGSPGATNTLTIRNTKERFQFYVNGKFSGEWLPEPIPGGLIGLMLTGKMKVQADKLTVVASPAAKLPEGWSIRSRGSLNSKVTWSKPGDAQALFRADIGKGGLMELHRSVEGNTASVQVSVVSGPCVWDNACGVFMETGSGTRLTLTRTMGDKGPVARFSTFASGKEQGHRELALPNKKKALKLTRSGATFSGQAQVDGKWADVASLDWAGLPKQMETGLVVDFSKPDPKLDNIISCIYRFEGLTASR